MKMDPCELTLTEQRDLLRARKLGAGELTRACLDRVERARGLNLFITETAERALLDAERADAALARGDGGALCGVGLAIKDLFCVRGVRTTAGSRMLERFVPFYESTVTEHLWRAGAVCLGKTSLDEFAMGSSNATCYFGPAQNPWRRRDEPDRALTPGGSSGGSAASVAACCASAAVGTDTGGSIRQPAAFCGVVGMKPTYGRCSRLGVVAFASSLDQPGPFGRSVRDVAALLDVMCGFDPGDSTSSERVVPSCEEAWGRPPRKGLRIGIPSQYRLDGMAPEIEALWRRGEEWLRSAGAELRPVDLPLTKYALPTYYIIAPAEASANLARYDGVRYGYRAENTNGLEDLYATTRAEGFGAEVKRRIMIGTYVLSAGYYDAYYRKAQQVRALIRAEFERVFTEIDLILTPTAPSCAFPLDEIGNDSDPMSMYWNDVFTVPSSLAGLPAISVPACLDGSGLPLGLQLIGPAFGEETVIQGARLLEEAAGFPPNPGIPSPAKLS